MRNIGRTWFRYVRSTYIQILIGNLKGRIRLEYLGSDEWSVLNSILWKQDAMVRTGLNYVRTGRSFRNMVMNLPVS